MPAPVLAIAQLSAPVRKEHQAKVDTLREELETALRGLQAQDEEESAKAKVKRCRLSMLEVGRILVWVVSKESWREEYKAFADFYKREGMTKQHVERLMRYAGAHDGIDEELLAKAFPDGLSTRNARAMGKIPEPARNDVVRQVGASPNPTATLNRLTQSLRANPVATVNEGVVPKQVKNEVDISTFQRNVTTAENWLNREVIGSEQTPAADRMSAEELERTLAILTDFESICKVARKRIVELLEKEGIHATKA